MVFSKDLLPFSSEASEVLYIIGLLRGRALACAEALNARRGVAYFMLEEFITEIMKVFNHQDHGEDAAKCHLCQRQSSQRVADFSIDF